MITPTHTDEAILAELGDRVAQHRLRQNLTQSALAHEAGISKSTLERLEAGQSTQLSNFLRVLRALGVAENLNLLLAPADPTPMEQLTGKGHTRQRATPQGRTPDAKPGPWTWGE